jgi:lipid-A-disaccharide synthase
LGKDITRIIRERQPKVVITVDYPGFNLRLLKNLRNLQVQGTKFCHVVAPQVWAWKPRRAKKVAHLVDRLCCFFPFEPPLFQRYGGDAVFVGHPLVDTMPTSLESNRIRQELEIPQNAKVLLLAPGSREAEVSALLPIFDEALAKISHRLPSSAPIVPIIAKSPHLDHGLYRRLSHHRLIEGRYRDLLQLAHVGLITSGTATLEAALAGLPHIIAYKGDALSAVIARQVILTEHVGLPNIVHEERVCPEVLQDQCEPVRLAAHLERMWQGPVRDTCQERLAQTRELLGGGDAMACIADEVLQLLP